MTGRTDLSVLVKQVGGQIRADHDALDCALMIKYRIHGAQYVP